MLAHVHIVHTWHEAPCCACVQVSAPPPVTSQLSTPRWWPARNDRIGRSTWVYDFREKNCYISWFEVIRNSLSGPFSGNNKSFCCPEDLFLHRVSLLRVIETILGFDVKPWTLQGALCILSEMRQEAVLPDVVLYNTVMGCCSKSSRWRQEDKDRSGLKSSI